MNIAYFTDTYLPQINGVVTSIEIFRRVLEQKGHNVYIFAPKTSTDQKREEDNVFRFKSAKFVFQPEHRVTFPYSRTLKRFSELNIDIIHSQTGFTMGLLAIYLAKTKKIPIVFTYHTLFTEYVHYLPMPSDYLKNFIKWASKSYCDVNNVVISPTETIKEELITYGVTAPVDVIPTGIEITNYHKIDTEAIRIKYDLDDSSDYLTSIARLGKEKNLSFLLECFQQIHQARPNTKLILIGDGPEKEDLMAEADKLGLSEAVIFTGYIDRTDIFPLLRFSKIFIFASKTETQGLVILEALSMKIPVVAVDAMGVGNVLEGNQGGTLCNEDKDEFSTAVCKLLADNKHYEKKANQAFKRALSMSANKMTKKLIKCYESIL
jgi:1,2-diacylglycerol 3-alpha-glucosyltransferase